MADDNIRDYWFASGTPSYLMRLLAHSNEDIQDIIARSYEAQEFVDYRATVEAPVPMIYQSGYLTIKGYNREDDEYKLDFPNHLHRAISRRLRSLTAGPTN